jgi:hypothetical protein
MHFATAPSVETEHQSESLQIGQGDPFDARTQLFFVPTAVKLTPE